MAADAEDVTERVQPDGRIKPTRPDFAFMKPRLSRWVALGFGSGLSPTAPGTVGTLFGWLTFALLYPRLGDVAMAVLVVGGLGLGVWAIERTGRDLGVIDHGAIVWDEIIAIWLVLLVVDGDFTTQLVAVLLFRFFDILKPPPVHLIDRRWKSGAGVMADDLMAAVYALLTMALWTRVFGAD